MADSAIIRKQHERRHRQGDHSICRPEHCEAPQSYGPGEVESAVLELVASVPIDEATDPRRITLAMAVRLAQGLDRRASATLSAELRRLLSYVVGELDGHEPDELDALRARIAQQRVERVLMRVSEHDRG